mgnify:CR=1 FL=1
MTLANSLAQADKIRSALLQRSKVLRRFHSSLATTTLLAFIVLALAISNLYLITIVSNKQITQIVVPPTFTEEISMRGNEVSESFQTAWAIFVAEKIGNINSARMGLTTRVIQRMIPANSWEDVHKQMQQQLSRLTIRKIEERFAPTDVNIDPKTKIVWVTGEKETKSIRTGQETSELWTFELKIVSVNGYPKIVHLMQYAGTPNTRTRSREIQKSGQNIESATPVRSVSAES